MKNFTQLENTGYTLVPNGVLKEKNLSLKALGVYFLIVSLPDNWNFSVKGLCSLCSDGKASAATAVTELEKAGFIKRTGMAHRNGKYASGDWIISDGSSDNIVLTENQLTEIQLTENQLTENRQQLNTKQINTNQTITKQTSNSSCELFAARSAGQRIIDAWNGSGLNEIKGVKPGSNRYKMLNARLNEYGEEQIIEATEKAKNSDFLKGQNSNGWVITFDWFLKPNNFIKVLEGNYDNRRAATETQTHTQTKSIKEHKPSYDIEAFKRQVLKDDLVYEKGRC